MATIPTTSQENVKIVPASVNDIPVIKLMVDAAYSKYIERLGQPPGPMTDDYRQLFQSREMYVLRADDEVLGSIILTSDEESVKVNNVVVSPIAQGRGYGRVLMNYAETVAEARGVKAVTLYTNVKMYENIEIYKKIGYVETSRRKEHGYDRVFFEKKLSP